MSDQTSSKGAAAKPSNGHGESASRPQGDAQMDFDDDVVFVEEKAVTYPREMKIKQERVSPTPTTNRAAAAQHVASTQAVQELSTIVESAANKVSTTFRDGPLRLSSHLNSSLTMQNYSKQEPSEGDSHEADAEDDSDCGDDGESRPGSPDIDAFLSALTDLAGDDSFFDGFRLYTAGGVAVFDFCQLVTQYFGDSPLFRDQAIKFFKDVYSSLDNSQAVLQQKYNTGSTKSTFIHNTESRIGIRMARGQNYGAADIVLTHLKHFVKMLIASFVTRQIHYSYNHSVARHHTITTTGRDIRPKKRDISVQHVAWDFTGQSSRPTEDEAAQEFNRIFPYAKTIAPGDETRSRVNAIYAAIRKEQMDNIVPSSLKFVPCAKAAEKPLALYTTSIKVIFTYGCFYFL